MAPAVFRFLTLGIVFVGLSCSSYDSRWKAAQTAPPTADAFAGNYVGTWKSARYNGAHGKLWCILTPCAPDAYRADFRATWHGIFSSTHSVILRVTERSATGPRRFVKFAGGTEIKMWIGSGRYSCAGKITADAFLADYDAAYDRGRFELTRVAPGRNP
jgi:hypothetical protein